MSLVLASASPQRGEILAGLGVAFVVRPVGVEERAAGDPFEVAVENARRKLAACPRAAGETVLGVDTLVATGDGAIWGKPVDEAAAATTLRRLAGTTHEVISGFAVAGDDGLATGHAVTAVTFRELDDTDIAAYVAHGEWHGRAGGYAIQGRGALLVAAIVGDYLNVVGLPVAALVDAGVLALR